MDTNTGHSIKVMKKENRKYDTYELGTINVKSLKGKQKRLKKNWYYRTWT